MTQTNELVRALQALVEKQDLAALAALRRGMGQPPGAVAETSRVVEGLLDLEDGQRIRDAIYVVAPLFADHPVSTVGRYYESNMGSHFHALIGNASDAPPSVERRFMALLAAEPDELADTLRQAISLLKSGDVAINWAVLLDDVKQWLDPSETGDESRRQVRLRWSKSFWRQAPAPAAASPIQVTESQPVS